MDHRNDFTLYVWQWPSCVVKSNEYKRASEEENGSFRNYAAIDDHIHLRNYILVTRGPRANRNGAIIIDSANRRNEQTGKLQKSRRETVNGMSRRVYKITRWRHVGGT